ncbi:MAG TPA: heavy-metal-associated domain-containing protein [Woeseiaceae bacterium]|nr:heavy-metal-associated domain-containing protein [Woeseiaceae bacterium]
MLKLRFVRWVIFVLLTLSATTANASAADVLDYELEVSGMVCAFCAYNVSRELKLLDGVDPKSIHVDLSEHQVRFRSRGPLDETHLAERIIAAGFDLESVTASTTASSAIALHEEEAVVFLRLELRADAVSGGDYDDLLTALGILVGQRTASVRLTGPSASEMRTLRPILMGRKPAIDVEYRATPQSGQKVLIEVIGK